ncbi:hypothetical protein [Caulobacter sp. 1776]|uniref:DUF6976 family protein n=1 Tax=Caulobacter sp. 1776 TaxID=3156420 RepID=UPI00339A2969
MSNTMLVTSTEAARLIEAGRVLLLAGDETLLANLPEGSWIGGTSANFITAVGGVANQTHILATDITDHAASVDIRVYDKASLPSLGADYSENGFSVILLPGLSEIQTGFARNVQNYEGVFNSPLIGWVAGVHLSEIGARAPKVFAGNGLARGEEAVVMHVTLPTGFLAHLDIVNLFKPGSGATIAFDAEGFETSGDCQIDGQPANLAAYIATHEIDTKLPLVADFNGAMINVSIQSVDHETGRVGFYAPVFKGVTYRFAEPVADYVGEFARQTGEKAEKSTIFSCNCILNYEYANLEGQRTGDFVGPVTFGEIAYMLLNQTLAYLAVDKVD